MNNMQKLVSRKYCYILLLELWILTSTAYADSGGIFSDSGQSLGSSNSYDVSLGDVDADGDLDAMVANSGQPNKLWLNDGSGNFTDSGQNLGSSYSQSVSLGDVDGDGDLDAVVANRNQANKLWLNDGSGTFTDSGQNLGRSYSQSVSLGDVDGDGDLDAMVANRNQANKLWLNDGSGTFTDSGQNLGNSYSKSVSLEDVDADGDLDAIVANYDSQANKLWLNDGSGTFTDSGQNLGSSLSLGISLGDVDGDGDLDLMVANSGQPNKLWLNDGSGTFSDSGQNLGSYYSQSVSLGDIDGDGDLDAVVANDNSQPNKLWLNDGSGNFTDSGQNLGNFYSQSMSLGDVDGDGDLDAVEANYNTQANKVWINNSSTNKVPSNLRINPAKVHAKVGDELTFKATGSSNGNYIWSTTGGELKALEDASVKYQVTEQGIFYIWVTDGNGFAWSLVDSRSLDNPIILIRFATTNLNLSVSEKQQIVVKAYDGNGNTKNIIGDVILESENPDIAQVMQNGQVTARGVGTTNLIANYQDKQAKMQVTVTAASRVLQVEPENIILSEGDSQTVKVYAVNQYGAKSLVNNAILNIPDSQIASVQNDVVTGVKKGLTWLDIVAEELSLSVPIIVHFRQQLAITPSTATIIKGNTVEFSISGGKPPYQIKATNGEVQKGVNNTKFVYKSDTSGTAKVTVIDSLNEQIEVSINIHDALDVTPKIARLTSQETVTLQAIGGDDNYFWTATKGQLSSLTDRRVEYTAPEKTGRYTVTVRDGLGNTKDILILVGEDLLLSQQQLFLEPDENVELTILGGESPYTVEVDAGNAEIVDSKINYKAPKVSGNYILTVSDQRKSKVSAEIKVALDLLITPLSSRIDASESLTLHAVGGFGNKRWIASKGSLDKTEGETVTWTAPNNFGPANIYAMDDAGTTAIANLEVASSGFAVTPSVRHVYPNDNANFTAVGGATPYTWIVEQGDYNAVDDETINYQADNIRGSYKIEITDSSGKKAQAQVNVYSTKLFASPKILYINKGETLPITIGGGTGNYTITSQLGKIADNQLKLEQDQRSITTNYTALKTFEGLDIIHILDTAGNLASIKVEIPKKDDIIAIYAGADGKIDEAEMNLAIDDFFAGQAWLDRTIMFEIAELFVGD